MLWKNGTDWIYPKRNHHQNIESVDVWKVFIPYANNIGTELNDDNLNTFIGLPGMVCTESYLFVEVDMRSDQLSSENLAKYLQTKFVRYLHSLLKSSHHGTKNTYNLVPLQDFSSSSDIDWIKSPSEIDLQLYRKYNFSDDEIAFIESKINEMK